MHPITSRSSASAVVAVEDADEEDSEGDDNHGDEQEPGAATGVAREIDEEASDHGAPPYGAWRARQVRRSTFAHDRLRNLLTASAPIPLGQMIQQRAPSRRSNHGGTFVTDESRSIMKRMEISTPPIKERSVVMMRNEEDQQPDSPQRTCIEGSPPHYACSFCGKSREEVAHLIAGPQGVYICNECVALCNAILAEDDDPAET